MSLYEGAPNNQANVLAAERKQELQSFLMTLDGIDLEEDEEDRFFTQLTVDTVFASHAAAKNCVRQYTQLLRLLRREEVLWAERVAKAQFALPGYKPRWHCTTCKYYQKESKLAAEKRRDWARESVSQNLRSQLTASGGNACLAPIQSTKIRSIKPIAHCESVGCLPSEPVNQTIDSIACTSASSFAFQDSDVAMEDATERDHDISVDSGQYHSQCTLRSIPRSFDDFLPADEDVNPSNSFGNNPSTLPDIQNLP
ncbi:uncharacterized protein F5891DRAFT_1203244 [Suillus fuscotomentosus]|uniref:Uncharacterized protein n=1 Tax=Suillus fuscotomentosus TaxID=1912939 RepID=A0AAD4DMX8_9AGAM|nr:uncharacterized protein F5891DRAFT_1203244 [Suillus fuscotomentosus]KAG1883547.1 hypothetical protein F5891DRAFT_1203244 [Suillus fuscotomentosus]